MVENTVESSSTSEELGTKQKIKKFVNESMDALQEMEDTLASSDQLNSPENSPQQMAQEAGFSSCLNVRRTQEGNGIYHACRHPEK